MVGGWGDLIFKQQQKAFLNRLSLILGGKGFQYEISYVRYLQLKAFLPSLI